MSVLLFILKLIGIILLAILGLILLALMLVLLVPVRYRISGQIEDEITVHAKITWFLHAISYTFDYQNGEMDSALKILGVRKKPSGKSALDEEPDDIVDEEDDIDATEDAVIEIEQDGGTIFLEENEFDDDNEVGEKIESDIETNLNEVPSLFGRIIERIRMFFATIKAKIEAFFDLLRKIKRVVPEILKKVSSLKDFLLDEMNQFVFMQVLEELKYLLGHFKFRTLETDLRFATGDPATTGQALGVLCMLPILYQYQVSIVPDFESEEFYVKGTFDIKGRMRGVHAVISLLRLIKQKEIRYFIKKVTDR